jgi:hypothetical protein
MDNLLTVAFEAHHSEWNHHRRYEIVIGRDLFNDWTASIRYGRTGQAGREEHFASSTADDIRAVIRPAPHRGALPAGKLQRRARLRCSGLVARRGDGEVFQPSGMSGRRMGLDAFPL